MTEPGAGERARELAMKAALEIGERLERCEPIWAGDVADIIERELSGALAAVRLEEREACIQDIQDAVGDWGGPEREHYTQAMQRATEAIKKREQGLDLWGRPLAERAVEGK